jgi:hypothetical protein
LIVDKAEFERRAAEMKARNLEQRQYRALPPPRSIFEPPRPVPSPAKVHLRDFLRDADIRDLSPQLAQLKRTRTLETDRDGLLNIREAGIQISVGPDLLLRGIKAYDAVLKGAAERGWPVNAVEGSCLKIILRGESLELAVTEKTDPVSGVQVRPGERRPRRPAGSLVISLAAGYRSVSISDKRGKKIETKLPELFVKAEALAHELRVQKEEVAARQREYELESRRRREIEKRLERLNREVSAWQRAEQIRA